VHTSARPRAAGHAGNPREDARKSNLGAFSPIDLADDKKYREQKLGDIASTYPSILQGHKLFRGNAYLCECC